MNTQSSNKLVLFESQQIRRIWYLNEWFYSVVDIIEALSESPTPRQYWGKLKQREFIELQLSPIWVQLKIESPDRKKYLSDCVNTKNAFRLIQSIPSKKAEPFKMWLAELGKERIEEIENPELATQRTRALYKAKGYPDEWIEKRMRGIAIREELTDEWKNRGAKAHQDYEILTAEISKATFGLTPSEYKDLKGLQRENLRDHMDDFELIFSMLGERSTTEIHRQENSHGVIKLKQDAHRGGNVAGIARKELEKQLGRPVITKKNYLKTPETKKFLKK